MICFEFPRSFIRGLQAVGLGLLAHVPVHELVYILTVWFTGDQFIHTAL
jgi:hypothetical protein